MPKVRVVRQLIYEGDAEWVQRALAHRVVKWRLGFSSAPDDKVISESFLEISAQGDAGKDAVNRLENLLRREG